MEKEQELLNDLRDIKILLMFTVLMLGFLSIMTVAVVLDLGL